MINQLKQSIFEAVKAAYPEVEIGLKDISLEHPTLEEHGDYSTNIALKLAKKLEKSPQEIAEKIVAVLTPFARGGLAKVSGANGFINFKLSTEDLVSQMNQVLKEEDRYGQNSSLKGKKMMVEFAHPNTHKELHIGHMRTLTTGESLARILEANEARVFRANYQGDIGPHVAKAIWGTEKLLKEKKLSWEETEKLSLGEKAHLLGQGYIVGNKLYDEDKAEIDSLNAKLYRKDPSVSEVYNRTRQWSLDYYDSFYTRFYSKFDRLYFESEVAELGKKIVLKNLGKVFEESEGAIVFPGEKYGLHTRVFVTKDGNPTYEGKDMALAPVQFDDFPFDRCVHVVANEQAGYFQVIIKALELIDPKFIGREHHLSMGMVQLVGKKISSRTGVLVTVDGLLDDVKDLLKGLVKDDVPEEEKGKILEAVTIAAVKYSVLKTDPTANSVFDLEKSVSLSGDSGPYIQYTYARARSVLRKCHSGEAGRGRADSRIDSGCASGCTVRCIPSLTRMTREELAILRWIYRFPEVVEGAAKQYAPNVICTYLFELAKRFNNLYNNCPILESEFRLALTKAVSTVLKNGLTLLGIEALERM